MKVINLIFSICVSLVYTHAVGASAIANLTVEGFKVLFVSTHYPTATEAQKATIEQCLAYLDRKKITKESSINQCSNFSKGIATANGPAFVSFTVSKQKTGGDPYWGTYIQDKEKPAHKYAALMCENSTYLDKSTKKRDCHEPVLILDCSVDPNGESPESSIALFTGRSAKEECTKQSTPQTPKQIVFFPPDAPETIK